MRESHARCVRLGRSEEAEPSLSDNLGNWRTAGSLAGSKVDDVSGTRDPLDFTERPCVKSRLARDFVTDQTLEPYISTGRTWTLYNLTFVSSRICDLHICFSSSVTQFLAIPIRRRISDSWRRGWYRLPST